MPSLAVHAPSTANSCSQDEASTQRREGEATTAGPPNFLPEATTLVVPSKSQPCAKVFISLMDKLTTIFKYRQEHYNAPGIFGKKMENVFGILEMNRALCKHIRTSYEIVVINFTSQLLWIFIFQG